MGELFSMECPCYSGKKYSECCEPFHQKRASPSTPLDLMRSRYAAYALDLADYIIHTTEQSRGQKQDLTSWKREIHHFAKTTQFQNLRILSTEINGNSGVVIFYATLNTLGQDTSYKEESHFIKKNGKWLYLLPDNSR